MKKFRRSTRSTDTADTTRSHHISMQRKDPLAIVPPRKVIRARFDYQPQHDQPGHLGFSAGDFLHVVAREDDPDWYEACNPLHGSRGLVPVGYFEVVGKQVRRSFERPGRAASIGGHDSGYAEKAERISMNGNGVNGHRRTPSSLRGSGAMVYGVVHYDFKAERPDELEAKEGEAIIVIAQSDPEWFLAKPITRLGGPGLIPVSFIEIRDMSTGNPVADIHDALARAGVPKVEEWKKMAADYKNSSIPLGRIDIQQGTERTSVGSSMRQSHETSRYGSDGRSSHQRNGSVQQPQLNWSHLSHPELVPPCRAKVPSYSHSEDIYWFVVEAVMEDGKAWELQRDYKAFYGLQLALIDQFPEAAGKVAGSPRTLPYMPGPLPWITEHITSERRAHLDRYIKHLIRISLAIRISLPVRTFFSPGGMDREIEPSNEADDPRISAISQQSSVLQDNLQYSSTIQGGSRHSSTGNLGGSTAGVGQGGGYFHPSAFQNVTHGPTPSPSHYRMPSDLRGHPPQAMRNDGGMMASNSIPPNFSMNNSANTTLAPIKIKVRFGDAAGSDCVIVRLPATFSYPDLVQKLRDRWRLTPGVDQASVGKDQQFLIEYADESMGEMRRIRDDGELVVARERNSKLTLRVTPWENV